MVGLLRDPEVRDVAVEQEAEQDRRHEERAAGTVLERDPGNGRDDERGKERRREHVADRVRARLADVLGPEEQDRVDAEQDGVDAAEQAADRDRRRCVGRLRGQRDAPGGLGRQLGRSAQDGTVGRRHGSPIRRSEEGRTGRDPTRNRGIGRWSAVPDVRIAPGQRVRPGAMGRGAWRPSSGSGRGVASTAPRRTRRR